MRANDSPLNRSFLFSYRTTPSKIHAMITSDTAHEFYWQPVLYANPGWSGSNYHHEKLAMLMIWVLALWPISKTFKYSWKQMQLCTTYLHNAVANTVSSHSKPWKKKKRDTLAVNIQSLNSITPNSHLKYWFHCHQILKKVQVTKTKIIITALSSRSHWRSRKIKDH